MTKDNFVKELEALGIICSSEQLDKLDTYYNLLVEWNEKINLTAITDYEQVYLKHFYDSLTIVKGINLNEVDSLCDVGTGAGFPGLVLKIFFPNLKVTLIDALNKRVVFLEEVIKKLELKDIEVIHARCEEYALEVREKYDVVTARAVASLPILMEYCAPLVKVNGYFIPLKANINEEIELSKNAEKLLSMSLIDTFSFVLPIENSNRTIVKYKKTGVCSKKYPRRYSEIKKRSL